MRLSRFKREDFSYQAAYCEENIWHLCQQTSLQNSYVVFILSQGDAFPMLNQRASQDPSLPIFWDYHVVLLVIADTSQIYDFDTMLPFNTDIETYFSHSFVAENLLAAHEIPRFRLVPSGEYVELFSSDRSHMKTPNGWLAPPPSWPLIGRSATNLSDYIQSTDNSFGELLTYQAVLERFKT
mgnify:FL=1